MTTHCALLQTRIAQRWPAGARSAVAALALFGATLPAPAADVGVSIQISEPGVYGRIDIGRFPQPQVIVAQPVVIARPRVAAPPVYLWVPTGHQKNWGKHCGSYSACGVPVYFVKQDWYDQHVRHGHDHGHGKNKPHGKSHKGD